MQTQRTARKCGATLSRVLTTGQALMSATCRNLLEFFPEVEIHTLDGLTEASVGVSHHMVTASTVLEGAVVPIGKVLEYVECLVCDPSRYEDKQIEACLLTQWKPGEEGELFIGGNCLAKRYIDKPERTSDAFFNCPGMSKRAEGSASPFALY